MSLLQTFPNVTNSVSMREEFNENSNIYEDWRKIRKWFEDNNTAKNKKIDAINKMLMMESLVRYHI